MLTLDPPHPERPPVVFISPPIPVPPIFDVAAVPPVDPPVADTKEPKDDVPDVENIRLGATPITPTPTVTGTEVTPDKL